jgi:hypothetical protein
MSDQSIRELPSAAILGHAENILNVIRERTPKLFDIRPVDQHMVGMFWRAVRLYDGVLILLKNQLPEEAAILGRSLFEVSLHLQQLDAEPRQKDALIFGWVNTSITEQIGLLRNCEPSESVDSGLAYLQQREKDNRTTATATGVTRFRSFSDPKVAARRFGREDDILLYEWSHESVHGTEAGWMFSRRLLAQPVVGFFAKNGDAGILSHVTRFAARSIVESAKAAFRMIGWTLPPELEAELTTIQEAFKSNGE